MSAEMALRFEKAFGVKADTCCGADQLRTGAGAGERDQIAVTRIKLAAA